MANSVQLWLLEDLNVHSSLFLQLLLAVTGKGKLFINHLLHFWFVQGSYKFSQNSAYSKVFLDWMFPANLTKLYRILPKPSFFSCHHALTSSVSKFINRLIMAYHKIVSICYVLFVTFVAMFSREKLNISSKSGPNKSP